MAGVEKKGWVDWKTLEGIFKDTTPESEKINFDNVVIGKSDAAGIMDRHRRRCEDLFDENKERKKYGKWAVAAGIVTGITEIVSAGSGVTHFTNSSLFLNLSRFSMGYAISHIVRNITKAKHKENPPAPDFMKYVVVERSTLIGAVKRDEEEWIKKVKQYNIVQASVAGAKILGSVILAAAGMPGGAPWLTLSALRDVQQMKDLGDFRINKQDIGEITEERKAAVLKAQRLGFERETDAYPVQAEKPTEMRDPNTPIKITEEITDNRQAAGTKARYVERAGKALKRKNWQKAADPLAIALGGFYVWGTAFENGIIRELPLLHVGMSMIASYGISAAVGMKMKQRKPERRSVYDTVPDAKIVELLETEDDIIRKAKHNRNVNIGLAAGKIVLGAGIIMAAPIAWPVGAGIITGSVVDIVRACKKIEEFNVNVGDVTGERLNPSPAPHAAAPGTAP